MATLNVIRDKCDLCGICVDNCPFQTMSIADEKVDIGASCRMCRMCIKKCPKGAIEMVEDKKAEVDKKAWKGVMVYVEHTEGSIHPVTLELIGKARELAGKINHPVYCLMLGKDIREKAQELLHYGVDKVFVYDYEELEHFRADVFTAAFGDCIEKVKPSIVLVGATSTGRSLAPRVATRFRTGLTADCTRLEVKENTDLVQIRPAFGGNIMAQIVTPNTRPQFATVRYKVMDQAMRMDNVSGTVEVLNMDRSKLESPIKILNVDSKEKLPSISDAEVLVVGGRGLKSSEDLKMLEELASLLGGQVAATRPLVEAGWVPYTKQIGLSGRTVKPKLIITCGVSGAVQFTACMNSSERIVSINKDRNAPIFKVAHTGIIGDLYEVVPALIRRIKEDKPYAI